MRVWVRMTLFSFFVCLANDWPMGVCVCVFESAHVHLSVNTLWLAGLPRLANGCTVWLTEACCSCVHRQQLLGWKNKMGEGWEAEREVERQKKGEEDSPFNHQSHPSSMPFPWSSSGDQPQVDWLNFPPIKSQLGKVLSTMQKRAVNWGQSSRTKHQQSTTKPRMPKVKHSDKVIWTSLTKSQRSQRFH